MNQAKTIKIIPIMISLMGELFWVDHLKTKPNPIRNTIEYSIPKNVSLMVAYSLVLYLLQLGHCTCLKGLGRFLDSGLPHFLQKLSFLSIRVPHLLQFMGPPVGEDWKRFFILAEILFSTNLDAL